MTKLEEMPQNYLDKTANKVNIKVNECIAAINELSERLEKLNKPTAVKKPVATKKSSPKK